MKNEIIIPTKEFKSKPRAQMWIDSFSMKYPEKKFTIIRKFDRINTYMVGELDHSSGTHFVFADGITAEKKQWIKSFHI